MRSILAFIGLSCFCLLAACRQEPKVTPPQPPAPARLFFAHFAGTANAGPADSAKPLREILAAPASKRLLDEATLKLAAVPGLLLSDRMPPPGASPGLTLPLVQDLLAQECALQVWGTTNGAPEWTLAVKLPPGRRTLWDTNLHQLALEWGAGPSSPASLDGAQQAWTAERPRALKRLAVAHAGEWLVAALGQTHLGQWTQAVARIRSSGRPFAELPNAWAGVQADLPQLAHWIPTLRSAPMPALSLTVGPRGNNLRLQGTLRFTQPFFASLPAWNIPTNIIREPMLSFMAFRGVASYLGKVPRIDALRLTSVPDQLFFWSQDQMPLQNFAAAPSASPETLLHQLGKLLADAQDTNRPGSLLGRVLWESNNTQLLWQGLPWVAPFLKTAPESGQSVLFGGMWPSASGTPTVPPELLNQFVPARDILHYGWEITKPRLAHWRALNHVRHIVRERPVPLPEKASEAWLDWILTATNPAPSVASGWPNSVTEIRVTHPQEIQITRSAPLLLTAFELIQFLNWVDYPGFPLAAYQPAPKPVRKPAAAP